MKKKLQLCFVDAKVWCVSAISKYLGNIFIELLRRGGIEATKGGQRVKSCRIYKENRALNHYPDLGDWFYHALHFKQNAAASRQCGSAAFMSFKR